MLFRTAETPAKPQRELKPSSARAYTQLQLQLCLLCSPGSRRPCVPGSFCSPRPGAVARFWLPVSAQSCGCLSGATRRVIGGSTDHNNAGKSNYPRVKHSADENQGLKPLSQQKLHVDRCHVNNIACAWEPVAFSLGGAIRLAWQNPRSR